MKRIHLSLAILLVLVGCGGGDDGGIVGGGGGGNGAMTNAQRGVAATAAVDAFMKMAGKTTAEKAVSIPAQWKAIPGFINAGFTEKSKTYWGIFSDGVPFKYLDDMKQASGRPIGPRSRAMDEVPIQKKLALMDSMGDAFGHNYDKVKASANKWGYSATVSRGFIEELAQVKDVAGFLWQTHGGMGGRYVGTPPVLTEAYGLWTDTIWDRDGVEPPQYAAMVAAGELEYASGSVDTNPLPVDLNHNGVIDPDERLTHEFHYMITPLFVKNHMSFGENSFVWIDACHSSTDAGLVSTFLNKGADVYLGWSNFMTNPNQATERAFDRMFAENAALPLDTPPYRPENLFDVVGWLQRKGYDKTSYVDPETHITHVATLTYFTATQENFALLRPNIEHANVIESAVQGGQSKLTLTGEFGTIRPYDRTVTVNGTPIHVNDWTTTKIECDIPNFGAGSFGPVVVTANGHKSNELPITLYRVHMTYLMDGPGSLFYKWVMVVNFRQDVHKARPKPWDNPKGAMLRFGAMQDSTATVTSGGTGPISGGLGTWSQSGPAPYAFLAPPAKYFYFLPTNIDTEVKQAAQCAFLGYFPVKSHVEFSNGTSIDDILPGGPTTNSFTMKLDDNYSLRGDSVSLVTAIGTGTLSWSTTVGEFAPDDKTQARPGRNID